MPPSHGHLDAHRGRRIHPNLCRSRSRNSNLDSSFKCFFWWTCMLSFHVPECFPTASSILRADRNPHEHFWSIALSNSWHCNGWASIQVSLLPHTLPWHPQNFVPQSLMLYESWCWMSRDVQVLDQEWCASARTYMKFNEVLGRVRARVCASLRWIHGTADIFAAHCAPLVSFAIVYQWRTVLTDDIFNIWLSIFVHLSSGARVDFPINSYLQRASEDVYIYIYIYIYIIHTHTMHKHAALTSSTMSASGRLCFAFSLSLSLSHCMQVSLKHLLDSCEPAVIFYIYLTWSIVTWRFSMQCMHAYEHSFWVTQAWLAGLTTSRTPRISVQFLLLQMCKTSKSSGNWGTP